MLYRVSVEAEFSSNLPLEKVEMLLQLALVNSQGNEIITDDKCSDKFAIIDYTEFRVERTRDECIYCGEELQDRMVDFDGFLEEKEICIDPACEGNRYYGNR